MQIVWIEVDWVEVYITLGFLCKNGHPEAGAEYACMFRIVFSLINEAHCW